MGGGRFGLRWGFPCFFSGKITYLIASWGKKFIQHVTPYRGVLLSVSCDVPPNLGRLVVTLIWHLNNHSAVSE